MTVDVWVVRLECGERLDGEVGGCGLLQVW